MDNWRQRSLILIVFLSSLNCLSGMDFSSSNIARFSYRSSICLFSISWLFIGRLLGLFCQLLPGNIYHACVGHQYILLRSGLRSRCARFHLRSIEGGWLI